jgi:general nucleoside transport system ATP-binding protein
MNNNEARISMKNICKSFGKVQANKNVNLSVKSGEIHALLGENGAGKSTLMNMLSGIYTPDSGSIFINNKEVKFTSPKDAITNKIGMIHQHFKLVDIMTAIENIILGQKTRLFLDRKKEYKKVEEICVRFGLEIDLNKNVYDMSVGEKQILEMIKVLYRGADILILDEPTAVFTPQETEKLFKIMAKMKEEGCAIIFITHKMDEVMAVSDRITVLRKGESIKTVNKAESTPEELIALMVGRSVDLAIKKVPYEKGEVLLEVKNLNVKNEEKAFAIKNASFEIHAGEVLGLAGIAGSGQKELCEVISGIIKADSGEIFLEGESIVGKSPREIITKGISMSFIPEDRLGMGLVGAMDIVDNLLLKKYQTQKGLFINRKPIAEKAEEIVKQLDIQTPGIRYPVKNLSGGNIQKVLIGREFDINPKLLIMAYPTRGLDINTCYTIYDLINEQKKKGVAILFINEELDVLIELSDRILVTCHGEITGVVDSKDATREALGLMMVGKKVETRGGFNCLDT